jgi:hypothetical protein
MKVLLIAVFAILISSFNSGCSMKKENPKHGHGNVYHRGDHRTPEYTPDSQTNPHSNPYQQPYFHPMDVNRDGYVTRHEFTASDRRFDILDRNHDGVLTRGEI